MAQGFLNNPEVYPAAAACLALGELLGLCVYYNIVELSSVARNGKCQCGEPEEED